MSLMQVYPCVFVPLASHSFRYVCDVCVHMQATGSQRRIAAKPYAFISPEALDMLVSLHALPHVVVDVCESAVERSQGDGNAAGGSRQRGAGTPSTSNGHGGDDNEACRARTSSVGEDILRRAVCVPEYELEQAFGGTNALAESLWQKYGKMRPGRRQVLVFVASGRGGTNRATRAAAAAAALGYSRCLVVKGGLGALLGSAPAAPERAPAAEMSRDAVAVMMGRAGKATNGEYARGEMRRARTVLIDLRRHDERVLYGSIAGSVHLPVCQMPRALGMDASEWQRTFRFPKPAQEKDIVILQCRTSKRARWAAHLLADAGWRRNVFVYSQGACGWRLDETVRAYGSYDEGGAPPEPERIEIESVDVARGINELQRLGVLTSTQPM